ncbi:MAG: hypothetical protein Aureis2KO_28950 [Aureisphaera sp.]
MVFIVSCKGQDKRTNPNDKSEQKGESTAQSQTSSGDFVASPFSVDANTRPNNTGLEFSYDGQLCHWVRNIFQDSRGNLWFGTNHFGLMRYNGKELEYFTEEDGLGAGRVNGITEDKEGNVWFCTYGGLTKYDGATFTNLSVEVGPIKNDLFDIVIDERDTFWISTVEGVVQFDGKEFTHFPVPKPKVEDPNPILSPNRVSTIMEDSAGIIWFGFDGYGITKFNPNSEDHFSFVTTENGLADNNVSEIMEDSKGNIWIGTMYGGISHYDGTTFTNFTKEGVIEGVEAAGFYEKDGNIWFSVEGVGVYKYDGQSFEILNEDDGLITKGVLSIFKDREGRFWFGGWKGLFRYDPEGKLKDGEVFLSVTKNGPWEQ